MKDVATKAEEGKVFTVFGAKGGVGTTTIAVNLATGMAQSRGEPFRRPAGHEPPFRRCSALPQHEARLQLGGGRAEHLAAGRHVPDEHPSTARERGLCAVGAGQTGQRKRPRITPEFNQSERVLDLMRSMFDFIVIDGGQSLGQISTYLIGISDKVLLVAIPNLPGS